MFRHPKYYKELKEFGKRGDRGKPTAASPDTDQAISSGDVITGDSTESQGVRPGPGPKLQATSNKPQAPSSEKKRPQASSPKQQASSSKPQATSSKI